MAALYAWSAGDASSHSCSSVFVIVLVVPTSLTNRSGSRSSKSFVGQAVLVLERVASCGVEYVDRYRRFVVPKGLNDGSQVLSACNHEKQVPSRRERSDWFS